MSQSEQQLTQGDAIRRFLFSAIKKARFAEFYTGEGAEAGEESAFCRRTFYRTMALREVDPTQALPCHSLAHADERGIVAFTAFGALPFHLQRWLRVDLIAGQSGEFPFQLGACGGVRLWCERKNVAQFTPFTRNQMQYRQVRLPLQKGKNRLLIHLDELAERETRWGLRMTYSGTQTLAAALPEERIDEEYHGDPHALLTSSHNDSARQLLALMQRREYGAQADALLTSALRHVSAREAGSVFSLLPLLQLWQAHQGEYFPLPLWRRVRSTLLGYRYGADERGCDAMCFDDERHAREFCQAQYLAGQLFPDALFVASGRRGREQQALARMKLLKNGWTTEARHDAK